MIKYLSALLIAVALSGCSSSGSDDDAPAGTSTTGTTTTGTTTTGTTTTGTTTTGGGTDGGGTDGGAVTPSGTISGAWFGSNNFGEGVMIVDANGIVNAFAANGSGQYETVFGPASGELQHFFHRDSENAAFADSFTLAGDPAEPAGNTPYALAVQSDGQQIAHTGAGGDFTMTFATQDDLAPISVANIAGTWTAKTSFCDAECNITLSMTFAADGTVSGFTQFNATPEVPLVGTVSAASAATQYLNVEFIWAEKRRSGVVYFDRRDPTRLFINTFGPGDTPDTSASFTASMIRG